MFRFRVHVIFLALFATQLYAATIFLGGTIRDQAPNTMNDCGSAGDANGGRGFTGTDFQISDYQDDEYGLAGKECNSNYGWYPPACASIAADRTPVYFYTGQSPKKNIRSPASFYNWFHDSNQTKNIPYNVPLTLKSGSQYSYSNDSFFPIDNLGWRDHCGDSRGRQHNYGYCLEAHTRFGFHGAETFQFSGDDDVWVYIDDRLVIDLGSLHPKRTKKITLSTIPGLTVGQNYRLDFFYCERHTTESNMELTTSIEFYCSYYDWCGACEGTGKSCCTADIINRYCNDGDACTVDYCASRVSPINDTVLGCTHTPIACAATNKCESARCDKTAGCLITALDCDDDDECTIDYCDVKTGCGHKACNGTGCPAECAPRPPCYDGNPCTSDTVLGYFNGTANCSNDLNTTVCDDHNVCTNDFCDSSANSTETACYRTNVTCIPNLCQTIIGCDRVNGCMFAEKKCPGADDFCQIASCDPLGGCIVASKVCVVSDPYCFKGICDSAKAACRTERVSDWSSSVSSNGILCALRYDNAVKGAAIGTGAAVGIAVGGAVAAGLFGYGGKKGYDYIQLMRNQKFDGVQNNPLYEQTNQNSDNPLYRYSTTAPA